MMAITANMFEPGPLALLTEAAWVAFSPSWMGVFQLDDADGEALAVGLSDGVAWLEATGASDGATLGSGSTVTFVMGAAGSGATGTGAGTTGTTTGAGTTGAGAGAGAGGVFTGGAGSGAGAGCTG